MCVCVHACARARVCVCVCEGNIQILNIQIVISFKYPVYGQTPTLKNFLSS